MCRYFLFRAVFYISGRFLRNYLIETSPKLHTSHTGVHPNETICISRGGNAIKARPGNNSLYGKSEIIPNSPSLLSLSFPYAALLHRPSFSHQRYISDSAGNYHLPSVLMTVCFHHLRDAVAPPDISPSRRSSRSSRSSRRTAGTPRVRFLFAPLHLGQFATGCRNEGCINNGAVWFLPSPTEREHGHFSSLINVELRTEFTSWISWGVIFYSLVAQSSTTS